MAPVAAVKRSTLFVKDGEGRYYLPRPTSWLGGWARHLWSEHYVGKAILNDEAPLLREWSRGAFAYGPSTGRQRSLGRDVEVVPRGPRHSSGNEHSNRLLEHIPHTVGKGVLELGVL